MDSILAICVTQRSHCPGMSGNWGGYVSLGILAICITQRSHCPGMSGNWGGYVSLGILFVIREQWQNHPEKKQTKLEIQHIKRQWKGISIRGGGWGQRTENNIKTKLKCVRGSGNTCQHIRWILFLKWSGNHNTGMTVLKWCMLFLRAG